jgi:CRISPR-associated exonuclease Cas4
MLFLAVLIFIIALVLLWQAGRRQKTIGLPVGRVIYSDSGAWGTVEQPFFDAELGLVGKPDYLVEAGGQIIPVEVKSTPVTTAPYDAHVFQLAAYCLLVQRHFGKRPGYGILHYPNRTFAVDYTAQLEQQVLSLLDEMHRQERRKELPRSHDTARRCSRCGFRDICNQRLL